MDGVIAFHGLYHGQRILSFDSKQCNSSDKKQCCYRKQKERCNHLETTYYNTSLPKSRYYTKEKKVFEIAHALEYKD